MRKWIFICALFLTLPAFSQELVWPGDANRDGVVNNVDVLYLGLGYNTQGIMRDTTGIDWRLYNAVPWSNRLPDSTNYAHLDCDGNGFIDENDMLAIEQNFGALHGALNPDTFPAVTPTSPLFYFTNVPTSFDSGDTIEVDVYVGDPNTVVTFFGAAFTFSFDSTIIKPNTIVITPSAGVDTPTNPILFLTSQIPITGSRIEVGLSRRANTAGTGGIPIQLAGQKLITISFIIEDNLIGAAIGPLALNIDNIRLTNIGLNKQSGQPAVADIPYEKEVGIEKTNFENFKVYPQPATGHFIIEGVTSDGQYMITDLTGKVLAKGSFNTAHQHLIDCSMLSSGLHLLVIETDAGKIVRKILID